MISFQRRVLDNGLVVLAHHDPSTQMAAVNLLYQVGARDESETRTGFAHLFEHLMFEGSANAPVFDEPIERAGGSNNAFTNNDITNYYEVLPAVNIETALWLESDRMRGLTINQQSLDLQKQVVIEEFKESYLNQPYGDTWLHLLPAAYTTHPYRWPTIGKSIDHIADASLKEVQSFYDTHYHPGNAILCIAGGIKEETSFELAEKWFGDLPAAAQPKREYAVEPRQLEARSVDLNGPVPLNSIKVVYHMSDRLSPDYYACDSLSDVLAISQSARLHQRLVRDQKLFSDINAYITGSVDPGLFCLSGKLHAGVTFDQAEDALHTEIARLSSEEMDAQELRKVVTKSATSLEFSEAGVGNRAMALCYFELLGDADLANQELDQYRRLTTGQLRRAAQRYLQPSNATTLRYHAN